MKLSQRGEYGLRALMFLGMNHGSEVVRIKDIAEQQNIPRRFLEHILNDLKSAGLVKSRRGAAGGYRLQGEPKDITIINIINHLEGPIEPLGSEDLDNYQRAILSVMQDASKAIICKLEEVKLSELCDMVRDLQGPMDNHSDYII